MKKKEGYINQISIIIPVYNCEQSIKQSIQSIQKQTMKDLEIICVNDGSTDGSAEAIRQLQEEDGRIILYDQDNQGSGAARNLGLSHATGEFIAFLDADDYYLEEDALESMFFTCKKHQVSVCGTGIRIERGGIPVPDKGFQMLMDAAQNHDVLSYCDFQFDYGYYGFLFERKLLSDNKLKFPLYRRFQDPVFLVKAMHAAGKFCFIDKALYVYRAPNVLTRFHENNVIDLLHGLSDNLQFAVKHDLMKLFSHTVERIEYEYADVICRNLSTKSLALLLETDQFIRLNGADTNYMIRPLQMVLGSMKELEALRQEELVRKLKICKKIYPYGAGQACSDFLQYLRKCNLIEKVEGILVTNRGDNPDRLQDIPVLALEEYQAQEGDLVMITVVGIYQKEVISLLEERGIDHYRVISSLFD